MHVSKEKHIRLEAGLSLTAAAALAGVSPGTFRAFELDVYAVTAPKRSRCEAAVSRMSEMARLKIAS